MDRQSLRAFLEVAESGSFSLAAEKLNITQPAVSKRVAALEHHLDTPLFDRVGRQITLTEAGRALLPQAEGIIRSILEAELSVRDLSGSVSGKLALATSHHIGLHKLPAVLRRFTRKYPDVVLDIDFLDSERAYDLMMRGKIELSVVTLNPNMDPIFCAKSIWPDPLHLALSIDHPLNISTAFSLPELSNYPAILPGLNTYTGQIVSNLFEQHGLNLNISMSTNYLETIKMMVSIGLGWSILPAGMLTAPIQSISLGEPALLRDLGYVYLRKRSLSNAATAFINELRAEHTTP